MKLHATIVISYRADSFGGAGAALDDVLKRARERQDVEIENIQFAPVPHPLPDGEPH